MTEEEKYIEALNTSEIKKKLNDLFQRFPAPTQYLILAKYSGIFNFFYEIDDDQLVGLVKKMEDALLIEDTRLHEIYKDFF